MNAAVFLLSAGILAFEVVLMRMFSIALWHHFAAMIISIALLGFGLSGALLSRYRPRFRLCALAFPVSALACGWLATRVPFHPLMIVWQPRELAGLVIIYALLTIPFTLGALAIGVALMQTRAIGRTYAANLLGSGLGAVAGLALCYLPLPVRMSEYKGLPKTLAMAGARIVETTHHPLGRVDIVECPALRSAPGLSVTFPGTVPVERLVFIDGEGGSAVANDGDYLEWLPSAAAYQFGSRTNVLVIGVGGGTEIRQARRLGAQNVTGVELHPRVASLTGATVADGRAFLRRSRDRYDLIQISLLDSLATAAAGTSAGNESYLYTVEALREMLAHLTGDGVVCITRWLRMPPRDELKLANTAAAAGGHSLFVRGWATGTLLVKRRPFEDDEVAGLRRWAERCAFEVEDAPVGRESLFDVRPATDDRPYFFRFFRWRTAPVFLRALGRQSVTVAEWGYVVAVATLAQAIVAGAALIALPRVRRRLPVVVYFACLGLGFMFVEIALLQKFVLILGHPLYAATAVITTVLVVAGLGSATNVRDARRPAAVIAGLSLVATFPWPGFVMMALLVAAAFFMGMMFPAGLARVRPEELPWAWGVNGCFSVIGAALAGVLAMDFGFTIVLALAAALYAPAAIVFAKVSHMGQSGEHVG